MYFLQTDFWARFKAAHGWQRAAGIMAGGSGNAAAGSTNAAVDSGSAAVDSASAAAGGRGQDRQDEKIAGQRISVLTRRFGRGPLHFTLAYVPLAPSMAGIAQETGGSGEVALPVDSDEASKKQAAALASKLVSCARSMTLPRDTLCVRFDVPLDLGTCQMRDELVRALPRTVRKNHVDIQPPDTVLLDLADKEGRALSEDDLLGAMKSKWRYNIRLAQKKGVVIKAYRRGDARLDDALEVFYRLYEQTASRDKIAIHPKEYYSSLVKMDTGDEGRVTLYAAEHEGDKLASIITVNTVDEGTYLYGASGNIKRNLMSTYLLQWTAIKDALHSGCKVYDFYGIPPSADSNHPMAGLYLFKTGFGGREVHRPGSIDVPLSPLYGAYTAAERMRSYWYKKVVKRQRHIGGKRLTPQ